MFQTTNQLGTFNVCLMLLFLGESSNSKEWSGYEWTITEKWAFKVDNNGTR